MNMKETERTLSLKRGPSGWGEFEVTIPGPWDTTGDMELANKQAGQYYFDANTKRAFRSRIYPGVFYGRFFIDSTQFVSSRGDKAPRRYKIRAMLDNAHTSSVIAPDKSGNVWYEDFPSLDSARRALERLVNNNP